MEITIKKYESLTRFKINPKELTKEERIKVENSARDSFLQELHKIFEDYFNCQEAYRFGYLTETQKENCQSDIFDRSGYEDIYDIFYDYNRWKMGLPIYIKFKLI